MKRVTTATDTKASFQLKMTPLIDVIFLLLIFFIMTMRFQDPEGVLESRLPESGGPGVTRQQDDREVVRLRIRLFIKEGQTARIFLQEREIADYDELLMYLQQLPRDALLVIEPESRVAYKYVVGVYNTCMKAHMERIVFAVSKV